MTNSKSRTFFLQQRARRVLEEINYFFEHSNGNTCGAVWSIIRYKFEGSNIILELGNSDGPWDDAIYEKTIFIEDFLRNTTLT